MCSCTAYSIIQIEAGSRVHYGDIEQYHLVLASEGTADKLHITAQSGPAIPVIIFSLHWSSQKGDQRYLLQKSLIRHDKRGTLSLQLCLSPERLAFPSLLPFYPRLFEPTSTEPTLPTLSCLHFSPSVRVSLVFHIASITFMGFLALLRLFSAPPDYTPLPSPSSGPQYDATVLLGHRTVAAMVTDYSLALPSFSRLPARLYSLFVGSHALYPLYPRLDSLPFSPPSLPSYSFLPSSSFPSPPPSLSRHRFLPPVPGALLSPRYYLVRMASGLALNAASYLQAPLLVYRDSAMSTMAVPGLLLYIYPDVADTRALLLPAFSLRYHSLSRLQSRLRSCLAFTLSSPPQLSFSFPSDLRSHPHSCLGIVLSPPPPFPFPLHLHLHHCSRPRVRPQPRSEP